jgi:hypothetical protein
VIVITSSLFLKTFISCCFDSKSKRTHVNWCSVIWLRIKSIHWSIFSHADGILVQPVNRNHRSWGKRYLLIINKMIGLIISSFIFLLIIDEQFTISWWRRCRKKSRYWLSRSFVSQHLNSAKSKSRECTLGKRRSQASKPIIK